MKVSIARGSLLEALSSVSKGLSSRTTLPILSGIYVGASGTKVTFQATDLEVSIRTACEGRIDEEGTSVLPGKLLTDIVRSLPESAITIETRSDNTAVITSGQSSFTVKTLTPEDYPKFPEVTPEGTATIPAAVFSRMVHQVSRSVSRDETRPILTGVLTVIEDSVLKMAATDSYRLCVTETLIEGLSGAMELVIPGKALDDVSKLAGSSTDVVLGMADNQVVFTIGETTFISRRIEGQFPNYRQLLPKEHTTRVVADREELLEAVKRVSLMAQHSTPLRVRIDSAEHTLTVSATTQDVGEATEDIQVTPEGEDIEIAFNHTYLVDGLAVAEGDTIALEVTSPLKPGVLRPADGNGFVYLLMPVRLG